MRRFASGLTLLEIMVTVAMVALVVIPLLGIREESTNHAFRSRHMMEAMHLGQQLIAEWMTDPDTIEDRAGLFDEDPTGTYRWEMTVEDFDLSTGRKIEPEAYETDFVPGDASEPVEEDVNLYEVRRLKLIVFYPSLDADDPPRELVLETFLPKIVDREVAGLLGPAGGN